MLQFVVRNEFHGYRLDKFLKEQNHDLLYSRTLIEKLIDDKKVSINAGLITKKSLILKGDDVINVVVDNVSDRQKMPEKEDIPLTILYEDEYLAIIDKPAGMTVHPAPGNYTGTLVNALLYCFEKNLSSNQDNPMRPGIVHRLDKDTSGVMIITKDNKTHYELSKLFAERKIVKTYYCICLGTFESSNGSIEHPIARNKSNRKKMAVDQNGKPALTRYTVLKEYEYFSTMMVEIETGRTHQIRVHLEAINHPVLGDNVYGSLNRTLNRMPHKYHLSLRQILTNTLKRQALHAWELRFVHPMTKKEISTVANIPKDLIDTERHLI